VNHLNLAALMANLQPKEVFMPAKSAAQQKAAGAWGSLVAEPEGRGGE